MRKRNYLYCEFIYIFLLSKLIILKGVAFHMCVTGLYKNFLMMKKRRFTVRSDAHFLEHRVISQTLPSSNSGYIMFIQLTSIPY